MTTEAIRIFLARDLSPADESYERLHEEADMETVWAPLIDVVGAVLAGHLQNPDPRDGLAGRLDRPQRPRLRHPPPGRLSLAGEGPLGHDFGPVR